jgi:hypothetical protein
LTHPHTLARDRFTPLKDQFEIDREVRLQRLRERNRRLHNSIRMGLIFGLAILVQVALIVAVSAQHEAWPW